MKKSQISLATTWIFVLIAGGFIILFVLAFIASQRSTFKNSISKIQADGIFYSSQTALTSQRYSDKIDKISEFDLETICYKNYLGVSVGTYTKKIDYIQFSPLYTTGTAAYFWSLPWTPSFPITNIVYLTTPRTLYLFDGNSGMIQELCNDHAKYFHNSTNILCNDFNFSKERLDTIVAVYDDTVNFQTLTKKINEKVKLMRYKVKPQNIFYIQVPDQFSDYGELNFTNLGKSNISYYPALPFLIGAIVSGSYQLYQCILGKSTLIRNIIIDELDERAQNLSNTYTTICAGIYSDIETDLNEIKSIPLTKLNENNLNTIEADHKDIQNKNGNMLWQNNCQLLY